MKATITTRKTRNGSNQACRLLSTKFSNASPVKFPIWPITPPSVVTKTAAGCPNTPKCSHTDPSTSTKFTSPVNPQSFNVAETTSSPSPLRATPTIVKFLISVFASATVGASRRQVVQFGSQNQNKTSSPPRVAASNIELGI